MDLNDLLDWPTPDEARQNYRIDATSFEKSAFVGMVQDVQREKERTAQKTSVLARLKAAKKEAAVEEHTHSKKQEREQPLL